jgi:hypothetical protein
MDEGLLQRGRQGFEQGKQHGAGAGSDLGKAKAFRWREFTESAGGVNSGVISRTNSEIPQGDN